jgi:hypothetical protein
MTSTTFKLDLDPDVSNVILTTVTTRSGDECEILFDRDMFRKNKGEVYPDVAVNILAFAFAGAAAFDGDFLDNAVRVRIALVEDEGTQWYCAIGVRRHLELNSEPSVAHTIEITYLFNPASSDLYAPEIGRVYTCSSDSAQAIMIRNLTNMYPELSVTHWARKTPRKWARLAAYDHTGAITRLMWVDADGHVTPYAVDVSVPRGDAGCTCGEAPFAPPEGADDCVWHAGMPVVR